jgi:hypothetical protein
MLSEFDGLLLAKSYQVDAWREAARDRLAGDLATARPWRTLAEWVCGRFMHTWLAPGTRSGSAAVQPQRLGGGS